MPETKKKHGGARPGSGRPKGIPNKLSTLARAKAEETGELPHEFLLRVSRGEKIGQVEPTLQERVAAANMAAPYFAPKLASVEHGGKDGSPIVVKVLNLPD